MGVAKWRIIRTIWLRYSEARRIRLYSFTRRCKRHCSSYIDAGKKFKKKESIMPMKMARSIKKINQRIWVVFCKAGHICYSVCFW